MLSAIQIANRKQQNQTVNDGVAHSKNPKKCAYHVTFDLDLDLDLENTLDAGLPVDHRVQIWWRCGKSLQTDRRTDDGRRAIALAHSWNELKINGLRGGFNGRPTGPLALEAPGRGARPENNGSCIEFIIYLMILPQNH